MVELLWTVIIILTPIVFWVYLGSIGIYLRLRRFDSDRVIRSYIFWMYIPFIFLLGGAYVYSVGTVPIRFHLIYGVAIVAGGGAYWLSTLAWQYYTRSSIRRGGWTWGGVLSALIAPVPEELLFREGLSVLIEPIGPVGYLIASSMVFGVYHIHLGTHEVVLKSLLGVMLGLIYLATGTIVASALAHIGYNLAWLLYVTDRVPT